VEHGSPEPVNPDEPEQVALAARDLELAYVVVTSVTRDDLSDGGANQFAEVISRIRTYLPEAFVEVLIPDFQGDWKNLLTVLQAGPDVVNHNIETVASLYPIARPGANYHRSLELLTRVREMTHSVPVKSGLMLGLGETPDEIEATLDDLIDHGCSLLTLGQYLQPSLKHLPVQDYLRPETFAFWKKRALEKGFWEVASGPFVRSSYKAHELYESFKR
jgi:lipoic acid synthetase